MIRFKKFVLNLKLLLILLLFMLISIITINSSMLYLPKYLGNLALKQGIWYLIGLIMVFIILRKINSYKIYYFFYFLFCMLLFLLLLIGHPINGSKCWFIIPGIGSFQPSEFMKVFIILISSHVVSIWSSKLNKKVSFKDEILVFFKLFIIFFIPAFLTFLEPDTGAVIIYCITILSILLISPVRKRWFFIMFSTIILFLTIFLCIYFLNQKLFVDLFGTDLFYRIDRILDWKNGTGMQLENSLAAIGSSGFIGHGYRNTPIYFPESGTDFIFAVFASNFGFIGVIIFYILLITFDLMLIDIAKRSNNLTHKYILAGTLGMIIYQQFQNIGMTLGLVPITGITLPFVSYGGSSLLSYLLIIGIVFKISSNSRKTIN